MDWIEDRKILQEEKVQYKCANENCKKVMGDIFNVETEEYDYEHGIAISMKFGYESNFDMEKKHFCSDGCCYEWVVKNLSNKLDENEVK